MRPPLETDLLKKSDPARETWRMTHQEPTVATLITRGQEDYELSGFTSLFADTPDRIQALRDQLLPAF